MIEGRLEEAAARFAKLAEGADVLSALCCEIEVTRSGHPRLVLEALSEANRNPAMAKALQKHTKGVHSLLADLLGKGQAAGAIDPTLDRHMTASLLISMIDGSRRSEERRVRERVCQYVSISVVAVSLKKKKNN